MPLLAIGLNHDSAPLDIRELLAFTSEQARDALRQITERLKVELGEAQPEAMILSTCNRTELFVAMQREHESAELLARDWLLRYKVGEQESGLSNQVAPHLYTLKGAQAVRHAFEVASGLDSMVLGEPQIFGQFKQAVQEARSTGSIGPELDALFQKTFAVAKHVRTHTAIGRNSVSMAAAVVKLASAVFPAFSELQVLLVGAGEMIEIVAAHFAGMKPRHMSVANRTQERGAALAERYGMSSLLLSQIPAVLAQYDVVVTSTASQLPLIGLGAVEVALKRRRRKPMVMVDLAVPRDIEAQVGQLDDVFLYTVDDLAKIVSSNAERRQHEAVEAQGIIEREMQAYLLQREQRAQVPLQRMLEQTVQGWCDAEVARAERSLSAGQPHAEVLRQMAHRLKQKFLHGPRRVLGSLSPHELEQAQSMVEQMLREHGE